MIENLCPIKIAWYLVDEKISFSKIIGDLHTVEEILV